MASRAEGFFKGFDGNELYFQSWRESKPVGTLVVVHGLGEHSECYDRLAHGIAGSGWDVLALDLRGHGRSTGQRGYVDRFDDFLKDLELFQEHAASYSAGRPMVLLGHSLGGLIVSKFILKNQGRGWKAAVLSSPLLGIAVRVPGIKKAAAGVIAKYTPTFTLYNELPFRLVTRDRAVMDEYERDFLRHDRISAQLYLGMLDSINEVMEGARSFSIPLLIQQAGLEQVVSRPKTEEFFEAAGAEDKKLVVYEKYRHEVYNDLGREKVFDDLKTWLARWK